MTKYNAKIGFAGWRHFTRIGAVLLLGLSCSNLAARDLADIKQAGVLRHIGVPYANFVSQYTEGNKVVHSGLDIELMQLFAAHLGVSYEFIPANWENVFGKLTGKNGQFINHEVVRGPTQPIEGDVMAHGVTMLEWRSELIAFSDDYFPSAVWLIARNDSTLHPIKPSNLLKQDILAVKGLLKGRDVLAMKQSCLDPDLYHLYDTGANVILTTRQLQLNEMVPAILNNDAESTLLDVADTLIALEKWPNDIKVIGPVSEEQLMAVGFRKESVELRLAFNTWLKQLKADGRYLALVQKYYPGVFHYYRQYFEAAANHNQPQSPN